MFIIFNSEIPFLGFYPKKIILSIRGNLLGEKKEADPRVIYNRHKLKTY